MVKDLIKKINFSLGDILVATLLSFIALSPSFFFGVFGGGKPVELRVEDFYIALLTVIGFVYIFILKKKKLPLPPFLGPILLWLGVGFLSTVINLIFRNLDFSRGFFYFLKETEFFFFYFFIFFVLKNLKSAKLMILISLVLGFLNVLYVFFQGVMGKGWQIGEYGTAAISERGVYPTGAFFLMLFIFLASWFFFYIFDLKISRLKKFLLGILSVAPALGVFGSDSKTNLLGLTLSVFMIFVLLLLKRRNLKIILSGILAIVFMAALFLFSLQSIDSASRVLHVFNPNNIVPNFESGRMVVIAPLVKDTFSKPFPWLLGYGVGFVGEAHNQLLRVIIETGLAGVLAFLLMMWVILKTSFRIFIKESDPFKIAMGAGLFTATLTLLFLGIGTDSFIVVKPTSLYWSFAAITAVAAFSGKSGGREKKNYPAPCGESIAAIVVSHKLDKNFFGNIDLIKRQVSKVIIISNGAGIVLDGVDIIRNKKNLGQGTALNQGVDRATLLGFKWVLLLDQDSVLNSDMVSRQIEAYNNCPAGKKPAIIGCNCIFRNLGKLKYETECKNNLYFERGIVMMSGILLPTDIFREIGPFREEFFIDSIDADYCLRVRAAGYKIIVACGAVMNQNVGENAFLKRFMRKEFLVTNHSAERCYYMTRNGLILAREYLFKNPAWAARRFIWHLFVKPGLVLLYEKDKKEKLKLIVRGAVNALKGKTGVYGY